MKDSKTNLTNVMCFVPFDPCGAAAGWEFGGHSYFRLSSFMMDD